MAAFRNGTKTMALKLTNNAASMLAATGGAMTRTPVGLALQAIIAIPSGRLVGRRWA